MIVELVVVCCNSNPVSLPVAGDNILMNGKAVLSNDLVSARIRKVELMLLSDETRNGLHITCTFTTL